MFANIKQNIHSLTMEHYSVRKRHEALTHATTQMNPENIVLRSHIQKDKYCDSTYMKSLDMQIKRVD